MISLNQEYSYNLVRTREEYPRKARIIYKFVKKNVPVKKFKRIFVHNEHYDCDVPMRLDLESGELSNYTRNHFIFSKRVSRSRAYREIMRLLDANDFSWFITLTFNKDVVDRKNDSVVYKIYKKWIGALRRKYPEMYFVTTVERHEAKEGEEKGCIHFHILMGGISAKQLKLVDSTKVCCSWLKGKYSACSKEYFEKTKHLHDLTLTDGLNVYNISDFYWGFTNVTIVQNQQAAKYYVRKYVGKELDAVDTFKRNYYYSKNIKHPTIEKDVVTSALFPYNISMKSYSDIYTKNAGSDYYTDEYYVRKLELDGTRYNLIKEGVNINSEVEIVKKQILMI